MADDHAAQAPPSLAARALSAPAVAARLAELRRIAVIEGDREARTRLERERPAAAEPFPVAVERRLLELRALCALASYLHRRSDVDR